MVIQYVSDTAGRNKCLKVRVKRPEMIVAMSCLVVTPFELFWYCTHSDRLPQQMASLSSTEHLQHHLLVGEDFRLLRTEYVKTHIFYYFSLCRKLVLNLDLVCLTTHIILNKKHLLKCVKSHGKFFLCCPETQTLTRRFNVASCWVRHHFHVCFDLFHSPGGWSLTPSVK